MLGHKMKTWILITLLLSPLLTHPSQENELELNKIRARFTNTLRENRTNALAIVSQKLQSGTPLEKDAALYVIEDELLLELVPFVIDTVTDITPAPRYDDTGWTYIGRHAAWVIAHIIVKVDNNWLKQYRLNIDRTLMQICNDESREKVKSLWTEWWQHYQNKTRPKPNSGH